MTRLSIAIPSKGRLKENTEDWLVRSGFKLRQKGGGRGYTATLQGLPDADVMLLSAREIAEGLISGALHVGVTGEDLLNDLSSDTDRDIQVMRLLPCLPPGWTLIQWLTLRRPGPCFAHVMAGVCAWRPSICA